MYSGPGATVSQGADSEASTLWVRATGIYQSVNMAEVRTEHDILL